MMSTFSLTNISEITKAQMNDCKIWLQTFAVLPDREDHFDTYSHNTAAATMNLLITLKMKYTIGIIDGRKAS